MGMIALPYLSTEGNETETPYGFFEVEGAELYKGAVARNRVVLRLDMLSNLTDYFSIECITKYRELIYTVMSGKNIDKTFVSKVLTALYKEDEVFSNFLGEIVYFDEGIYKESLYVLILRRLVDAFNSSKTDLLEHMRERGYKSLFESKGYLYISVPDVHKTVSLPEGYQEEVLSYAKIWPGTITKYQF